jgi:hypothetical protein
VISPSDLRSSSLSAGARQVQADHAAEPATGLEQGRREQREGQLTGVRAREGDLDELGLSLLQLCSLRGPESARLGREPVLDETPDQAAGRRPEHAFERGIREEHASRLVMGADRDADRTDDHASRRAKRGEQVAHEGSPSPRSHARQRCTSSGCERMPLFR